MTVDFKFDRKAERIIRALQSSGHRAFFVGGCVRDLHMGRTPKDWDIVTSASPDEIRSSLDRIADNFVDVGLSFGIVVAVIEGEPFEVATMRRDVGGTDGRHPDSIEPVRDIDVDLGRRDFNMNAVAFDPVRGIPVDPFCGLLDIWDGVIDFVGDPAERIREDRLRVLRAIRFVSQLGFEIDPDSLNAIMNDHDLTGVSQERVTAELTKILIGDSAPEALRIMRETGILWDVIPELRDLLQPHDNPWHNEADETGNSIWAHVALVFESACALTADDGDDRRLRIRLAALMHDVGKPSCRGPKDGHSNFHEHDRVGARMTREILTRMRFPNDVRDSVVELVRMHMTHHDIQKMRRVHKARRLLGRPDIDDILTMGEADTMGTVHLESTFREDRTMESVRAWRDRFPVMLPDPIVTGDVLIAAGGKPGPKFKDALSRTFDQQLNGVTDAGRLTRFALNELK